MYNLFKFAVVMLAFAVYTSAEGSTCKCRDNDDNNPDNNVTGACCKPQGWGNYGCAGDIKYSHKHHRCVCGDEGLFTNQEAWNQCCKEKSGGQDHGSGCTKG